MLVTSCDEPTAVSAAETSAVFPAAFATQYTELRDCRHSHEHELNHIRVLVNDLAKEPYARLSAEVPYPVGAILVKAEYDDDACTMLVGYTAMRKEPAGYAPDSGDWRWQKLDTTLKVLEDGSPQTCIHCHEHHCAPAGAVTALGYDLTCAEEL
ncbi:MAG: hypothetical protein AMXMBFR64_05290 [Myxococcales bacterium]